MLRFLLFVAGGSLMTGMLWSLAPVAVAYGLNWLVPYNFEKFLGTTQLQHFVLASSVLILPISVLSVVRTGRRMHFNATDGRPALLGSAGSGSAAARIYSRRVRIALVVSGLGLIFAITSAKFLSSIAAAVQFPVITTSSCLLVVVGLLSAIEFNDLRRTANLGALQ